MKAYFLVAFSFILSTTLQAKIEYASPLKGQELPIGNLLQWETAWEEEALLFVVERSKDGQAFNSIKQLPAANQANGQKYQFLDTEVSDMNYYYRLKAVGVNESVTGSIISIIRKAPNHYAVTSIYSTEVNTTFECSIDAKQAGDLVYRLIDTHQKILFSKTIPVKTGTNDIYIDMVDLPKGVYTLELNMETEQEQIVFKKLPLTEEEMINVRTKW